LNHSILKRAQNNGIVEVAVHDIRDFTTYAQKQIDDYQYGGGAGMVLMAQPLANVIEHLKSQRVYDEIIYLTPDGATLNQKMVNGLSLVNNIMLICGHYKGIDHRIRELYVTKEISIGDFVLSGGEIAAATIVDAVGRVVPGVLNNETSALTDSFQDDLLAPPVYTRPAVFNGVAVPEVLLSGNPKLVEEWRSLQATNRTQQLRPDLIK
jgi:tRNA (guanine37-N1)-methyltransferase